jgi:hypothetical protein
VTAARTGRIRHDDTGSLPLAMLLTLVAVGISTVLLSTVLQQAGSTRADIGRTRALNAATTGLEVGIGAIRVSVSPAGAGLTEALPCAPITGVVTTGGARYSVSIRYLLQDPRGRSEAWLAGNSRSCPTALPEAPRFARLTSDGTDTASGRVRSLYGVYTFKIATNVNVPGGQIQVLRSAGEVTTLCLDAGPSTPGTLVRVQPCTRPITARQTFAYARDLTLVLVSSLRSYPKGLCLDAGPPETLGAMVRLQLCGSTTLIRQQWSYSPNGVLLGTSDGAGTNGYCFNVQIPGSQGSSIVMGNNSQVAADGNSACFLASGTNQKSFHPDASVGAGAAGAATGQLVNYRMFGRCLDLRSYDVDGTVQTYPCKQAPDPDNLEWNQLWVMPPTGVGVVYTDVPNRGRYCIVAPAAGDVDRYVTLDPCPPGGAVVPDRMRWRVRGSDAPVYAEKYRIESTGSVAGSCLTTDLGAVTARVRAVACSADNAQKWNAEADLTTPRFSDLGEQ